MTTPHELDTPPCDLDIRPLTRTFGAEVFGVDLGGELDDDLVAAIRVGLSQWKVLVFRQNRLDHAAHLRLTRQLGLPNFAHAHDDKEAAEDYPTHTLDPGYPELYRIDNKAQPVTSSTANSYERVHASKTHAVNPPAFAVLRADVIPDRGGDTTYFDTVSAYEGLASSIRALLDGLWAEHGFTPGDYPGEPQLTRHPVVRLMPETAEKGLLINPVFTRRIIDVSLRESRWILSFLFAEIIRPAYSVRIRWDPATVVVADNRRTVHLGPQDLGPHVDHVVHISWVAGDVPIGVDRRASQLIQGRPLRAAGVSASRSGKGGPTSAETPRAAPDR
jgi:alpha-ketoglutarate-dependent taurine dioxygenase